MAYADYSYYTGTYKGNSIPEADFDRLITRASSYLDKVAEDLDSSSTSVMMAACAVAEAWQKNEQGGELASQSVGPWSRSYQTKEVKSDSDRLFEAAQLYLGSLVGRVRWC